VGVTYESSSTGWRQTSIPSTAAPCSGTDQEPADIQSAVARWAEASACCSSRANPVKAAEGKEVPPRICTVSEFAPRYQAPQRRTG
jgi:hypothetical protein